MTQSLIQIYSISTSKIELSKGHMLVRKVAKRSSLLNDLKHEGTAGIVWQGVRLALASGNLEHKTSAVSNRVTAKDPLE